MSIFRALQTTLLALQLLVGIPAAAQLAPNSPWKPSSDTDFLNLYQSTTATAVNPEILLLIDQSLSTVRMMFHPLFPNNWQDEVPPNSGTGSTDYVILLNDTQLPTSGNLDSHFSVGFAPISAPTTTTPWTVVASGKTYTIGGSRTTLSISGNNYGIVNTLIKPDGSEVTAADVTASGGSTNNIVAWLRCASHARLYLSAVNSGTLPAGRVIDFPLDYKPLDSGTALPITTASGLKSGATNLGGLTIAYATDPNNSNAHVQFDTVLGTTVPALDNTVSQTSVYIDGGNIAGAIRSRYIEWVFVGLDPSSPGGAYYCIPNAIKTVSTALCSIDPNSIVYNGSSASYSWSYLTQGSTPPAAVGTPPTGTTGWYYAFNNALPNRTRNMAIKEAAIKSWLHYQGSIFFAFRQLNDNSDTPNNSIPTPSSGTTNGWTYINTTSDLSGLAAIAPSSHTPMIESLMNSYCQFTNPAAFQSMINAKGYVAAQLECLHHFIILCTDGAPDNLVSGSESTCSYPYNQTTIPTSSPACTSYTVESCPAYSGNSAIKTNTSFIAMSTYWNPSTMAGIAAHGGDGSTTNTMWIRDPKTEGLTGNTVTDLTNLTANKGWLPFWVTQRTPVGASSGTTLQHAQPIMTMTVGVSLGVDFLTSTGGNWSTSSNGAPTVATTVESIQNDLTGSKFRLLTAAMVGDPFTTTWTLSKEVPFFLTPGTSNKDPNAAYFFDGRDPATLVNNIDAAIQQALQLSGVSSTAAPVFPTVGAGLGNAVYVSQFEPPANPGPLWTGDVEMFATKSISAGTVLIDSSGNTITGSLTAATPMWSAANAIATRGWLNRRIWSRPPSTSATPAPAMVQINLGTTGANTSDPGYSSIVSYLPGANSAAQLKNWQFFTGADVSDGSTPLGTRSSSIMGDVIDSAPVALQYSYMPTNVGTYSPNLAAAWAAHAPSGNGSGITGTADQTGTFRLVFVGDNQGLFHALGEVEWVDNTTSPGTSITHGVVDELWAFAPTEIIPNIDQLQVSSNKHYYGVDGAPTVYLLDLPQGNAAAGNGIFSIGASPAERAVVIFGLGKGGRSYYAINIADPFTPALAWTLCPNEQYNVPSTRIKGGTGAATVIANMGLSTCVPTIARVATSTEGTASQVVDVVLLGGGYSDPLVEAALPASSANPIYATYPATGTALGRGALAIDVYTGNILNTWNTSGTSGAGPVVAGVVPMEIDPSSGMTARGYFTDYYGSLWRLGGTTMQASPYTMFRTDTVSIDSWNASQVYDQQVSLTGGAGNGLCTTLPAAFLLSYFPYVRSTAPQVTPFAVGIAFETGDRNNPLDTYTYTKWAAPTQHRVNVLFDRQDINSVISGASGLYDDTSGSMDTNSGDSSFFLKSYYGYSVNFPAPSGGFIPKGITSPLLLDNHLFYSYFTPTTATCNGGQGTTSTYQVCNVMVPVVNSGTASSATPVNGCQSGEILAWTGVASSLAARSLVTGVQAGLTSGGGTTDNTGATQNLILQNLNTQSTDIYPKIRVWRIVH